MSRESFVMDDGELTKILNQGLGCYLSQMLRLGVITQEQLNVGMNYQLVCHRKGFFNKVFDKLLFKTVDTDMRITVVKLCDEELIQKEPITK